MRQAPQEGHGDRYCELGGLPAGRVPRYLNSVLFSALCLALPRVLCGHLTLRWIRCLTLPDWVRLWTRGAGDRPQARACSPAGGPVRVTAVRPAAWHRPLRESAFCVCSERGGRRGGEARRGRAPGPDRSPARGTGPAPACAASPAVTAQIPLRQLIFMEISRS